MLARQAGGSRRSLLTGTSARSFRISIISSNRAKVNTVTARGRIQSNYRAARTGLGLGAGSATRGPGLPPSLHRWGSRFRLSDSGATSQGCPTQTRDPLLAARALPLGPNSPQRPPPSPPAGPVRSAAGAPGLPGASPRGSGPHWAPGQSQPSQKKAPPPVSLQGCPPAPEKTRVSSLARLAAAPSQVR